MCDYGWDGKDMNSKSHRCLLKTGDHHWDLACDHDAHDGRCCRHESTHPLTAEVRDAVADAFDELIRGIDSPEHRQAMVPEAQRAVRRLRTSSIVAESPPSPR